MAKNIITRQAITIEKGADNYPTDLANVIHKSSDKCLTFGYAQLLNGGDFFIRLGTISGKLAEEVHGKIQAILDEAGIGNQP
jgi:hypothetical protein